MRGLDVFKQYFKGFENNYVIIGGTACTVLMDEAGGDFRATKDFDIVLILENISKEFTEKFWSFIKAGNYSNILYGQHRGKYYRFEKPANTEFPIMIELFSRMPTDFMILPDSHLLPLHVADDVSSLSAILLDDGYYNCLLTGKKTIDGVSVLDELHLIPFKAKAWCELTDRYNAGEVGLSKHIKKHKKDIAILLTLIQDGQHETLTGRVLEDMKRFVDAMHNEILDIHSIGIENMTTEYYCGMLQKIYGLT